MKMFIICLLFSLALGWETEPITTTIERMLREGKKLGVEENYRSSLDNEKQLEDDKYEGSCDCIIADYARLLVQTTDLYNITVDPLGVFDIGGSKAFSSGFYTDESYARLTARGYETFLRDFGINVSQSIPFPPLAPAYPDVALLTNNAGAPFALSFPYGVGLTGTLRVASDTERCSIGAGGKWFFLSFGRFIQFIAAGNLTTSNGVQHFENGDFILDIDIWEVKQNRTVGGWLKPENHFYIRGKSIYISRTILSSQYRQEQLSTLEIWSRENGYGRGQLSIVAELAGNYSVIPGPPVLATLPINQFHRGVYSWDNCPPGHRTGCN